MWKLTGWLLLIASLCVHCSRLSEDSLIRIKDIEEQLQSRHSNHKNTVIQGDVEKHSFVIDPDLQVGKKHLPTKPSLYEISRRVRTPVEAYDLEVPDLVDPSGEFTHGLLGAVHMAFKNHLPLTLSPDHIWACIAQGFAQHVNQNAEKMRHLFVSHEGKVKIKISRDEFVKGDALNAWPEVFGEFSEQIRQHIGNTTHDMIVSDFSTTSPVEKAVSEIVLMDAVKSYFDYEVETLCGIPSVTLEGTVDDWKKVRAKAALLQEYDLDWWIPKLLPALDIFVNAAQGKVDKKAWQSIYKYQLGSGGYDVTGWITTLFPYLEQGHKMWIFPEWNNETGWSMSIVNSPQSGDFPSGLSSVPFTWNYLGNELKMKFIGGHIGFTQDPDTLAVRPELSWAVTEDVEVPEPPKDDIPNYTDYDYYDEDDDFEDYHLNDEL